MHIPMTVFETLPEEVQAEIVRLQQAKKVFEKELVNRTRDVLRLEKQNEQLSTMLKQQVEATENLLTFKR